MASCRLSSVLLLVSLLLVSLLAVISHAAPAADDITAPFPGVVDLEIANADPAFNFDSVVGKDKAVLVEFYAPWCGWCKRVAPNYKQVGTLVSTSVHANEVVVAKVNADKHSELASRFNVRGFPTIVLFKKGDSATPVVYNGDRSPADLIKFINREAGVNIPDGSAVPTETPTPPAAAAETAPAAAEKTDSHVKVLTPDNFDQIVLDSNKHVLVKFYAPWCGHCKRMVPAYEELAAKFSEDAEVVIAKIDASEHRDVGGRYGVRGFPTIKLFTKSDKSGNLQFSGARDVASMGKFINEKRGTPETQRDEL